MKKVGMIFLVILVILLVYFNIWVYRVYNRPPIIANEQVDRHDVIESSQNSISTEKFDENFEYERNHEKYSFEEENIEATEENIEKILKQIDSNYDSNAYVLEKASSGMTKVNEDGTYETVDIKYLDYALKIGDFKFEAGFVVKVQNEKIIEVVDNNVNEEGMNLLLANKDYFEISKEEIDSYIERAKSEYIAKDTGRKIVDYNYLCGYDLSSKKKSIYIDLEVERHDTDSIEVLANPSYSYEID